MRKSRYTYLIKIISIICLVTMLFSACGADVSTKSARMKSENIIIAENKGDNVHKTAASNYESVCKSGLIEMFFDKTTMTVAIKDTNSNNLWTTLPQPELSKNLNSSAVEITLSNGDENVYVLNSQDNSVAFGNASYTVGENNVSVKYAMSLDAEIGKANIDDLKKDQIRADLTVIYTLRDGSFFVNVSMNTLSLPKGVYLEKVKILGDFGAYEQGSADDYIFVPDGSGALIMTGVEDKEFNPISLSVYGNDLATTDNIEKSNCLVGAFGMKRGNGAFLCIIEQGDSIAEINANRNSENSLNSVSATFKTTDIYKQQNKNSVNKTYGYTYKNEITLCYRFLSGKSATYSGMATACRENLIRNSVLSTKKVEPQSKALPLVVSLQGGYINAKNKYTVLSNFAQAKDLMTLLKAKGVNNAILRYNGLYDNANNGSNSSFGDFTKNLGKEKEFNELYSYLNSQKFSLYLDTDILTYSYTSSQNATNLNDKNIKLAKNKKAPFPSAFSAQSFISMNRVEKKVEDTLNASFDINFDGYALNDIGAYLYSDYSSDFYSRTVSNKEIFAQLPVLATSKKLMVDTGNFYAIKSADIVSEIPMAPVKSKESNAYVGIPFVQMMLHGICEYSAPAMNNSENMTTSFLKSVEYGCLPNVSWYCSAYDDALDANYYYDKNINDVVALYTKANSALATIRDARMTAHDKVQDGVYCTEYNNSIKVYVNYTDKPVTINGITVNATDCVAIS